MIKDYRECVQSSWFNVTWPAWQAREKSIIISRGKKKREARGRETRVSLSRARISRSAAGRKIAPNFFTLATNSRKLGAKLATKMLHHTLPRDLVNMLNNTIFKSHVAAGEKS